MRPQTLDCVLIAFVIFFVGADILLALSLVKVLPQYVTMFDWYPVYSEKVAFEEASYWCSCLYGVYPNGTDEFLHMRRVKPKAPQGPTATMKPPSTKDLLADSPFLVSYNQKVLKGGRNFGTELVCAGALYNSSGVIVSSDCAAGYDNPQYSKIGSNALYPLPKARAHSIKASTIVALMENGTDNAFYLEIDPPINYNGTLLYDENAAWDYAYVVGWEDRPAAHEPFTIEHWTTVDVPANFEAVCNSYKKKKNRGKLAFTYCHQLLNIDGFEEGVFCRKHTAYKYYEQRDGPIPESAKVCKNQIEQ